METFSGKGSLRVQGSLQQSSDYGQSVACRKEPHCIFSVNQILCKHNKHDVIRDNAALEVLLRVKSVCWSLNAEKTTVKRKLYRP